MPVPSAAPHGDRAAERSTGSTTIRLGFAAEPIVDLSNPSDTGTGILYHECLARLFVAESISLKAADFVDDLERGGAIHLLDAAMVDLVLDALADEPHTRLGCNISPHTLASLDGWAGVLRRIAKRSWLASRLTLEITESAPLDQVAEASQRLQAVRALGCRIALDDFGAGFASMERVRSAAHQWDIVKIDRSCFDGLNGGIFTPNTLAELFSSAASLAPVVVLEGIETEDHRRIAVKAGARYGQGWLFKSPPREGWTTLSDATGSALVAGMTLPRAPAQPPRVDRTSVASGSYGTSLSAPREAGSCIAGSARVDVPSRINLLHLFQRLLLGDAAGHAA